MTSDGWLKLVLKTLVYREGGANSSGFRGMSVGNIYNSCHRCFWCGVGMENPDSAVYEEHPRI